MAEGVDYSFSVPSAAGLAAAGKRFAGRYVGPGFGKFVTPAERDALFAAGLDIFLNVEGSAGDAAGGYGVGQNHASLAREHAARLGAPSYVALYFAVDFDVSSKGWPAVREYLRGAASIVGFERVGVYGGVDAVTWAQRDGVASWFFQTYAWSAGQWFAGNHVEQYLNGVWVGGGQVDLCRSRTANFGQWRANGVNPSPGPFPPPAAAADEEDDMPMYLLKTPTGHQYRGDGLWYAPIMTGAELEGWQNLVPPARRFEGVDLAWWGRDVTTVAGPGASSGGLTVAQAEEAAFQGAQRAERE